MLNFNQYINHRSDDVVRLRFIINTILLVCLFSPSAHAYSFIVDTYEQKGKLETVRNLVIVAPRVIVGNRETLGQRLDEQSLLYQEVSRAVYLSSVSAFNKKGYQ